jgi:hypothetical protein
LISQALSPAGSLWRGFSCVRFVCKRPAATANIQTTPSTIVGLGVFNTRAEAEAGLKKMDVCDDEDQDKDKDKDKQDD